MDAKNYLKDLFRSTLDVCAPLQVVGESLTIDGKKLSITDRDYQLSELPIYVWAAGKAAVPMYQGISKTLRERIDSSLVICPTVGESLDCSADIVMEGSHPLPNKKSMVAGKKLANFVQQIPDRALVISLISGGASSLVCYPAEGLSVNDLNQLFKLLNHSGAAIEQINTVRKYCSRIKGGGLLEMMPSAVHLTDLVISDVPGNDPATVGSGLTIPGDYNHSDTLKILKDYGIWDELPVSLRDFVENKKGEASRVGNDHLDDHHSSVISSAEHFAQEAAMIAEEDGLECVIGEKPYNRPVSEAVSQVGDTIKQVKISASPTLFLFYGESTVNVTGRGKGGRNQDLALRALPEIAGEEGITWLCAGTDGIDGPTDAAGAVVDGHTLYEAQSKGLDAAHYLQDNDSYHFHQQS